MVINITNKKSSTHQEIDDLIKYILSIVDNLGLVILNLEESNKELTSKLNDLSLVVNLNDETGEATDKYDICQNDDDGLNFDICLSPEWFISHGHLDETYAHNDYTEENIKRELIKLGFY